MSTGSFYSNEPFSSPSTLKYTWWCGFKFIIHVFNGLFKVPVSMLFEKLFVPSDELSFVWYGTGLMATRLSNISRTLAFTFESRGTRGVNLVVYSFVVMKQRNKQKKKELWRLDCLFRWPLSLCSGAKEDHLGKAGEGYWFFIPLMWPQSFGGSERGRRRY